MAIEKKILVERRFRVPAGPGEPQEATPLTWEDLTSEHVVVVLGEPGSGKSTEFEEAGKQPGAIALPIRRFLRVLLDSADLRSKTLFLDALDEMRSGPNRHEVLDSVIQRLEQLDRPKVRLSCRAADWFGDLDRSELASVSPSGEVRVVELLPLTEDEVERIVRSHLGDPSEFLARVRQQRLEGWLGNPQTLELMIKVAQEGRLPETRSALFDKACALMADEENRTHRQARQSPIGRQQILEEAGFLCALALITGLGGFAGDRADSDMDFPPLDEIPGSLDGLRAAIGTRLFRWQEGRALPVHRTLAEFLAARTLRDRLAKGLPLARVLRLITGFDGGTLSDLRGLYAWLTTLVPQHAPYLASKDPVALIFYGDSEVLPPDAKRVVLSSIEELADRDPWFFYEGGSAEPFGGLADPALIPDFRAALLEPNRHNYLRLSVMAALAYGRPLPELKDDLQRIVYSQSFTEGIRELGLKALCNVSTAEELLTYLDDVQAGQILDENDNQRAYLLGRLYPGILNTAAINQYLTRRKSPQSYFAYYTFLRKVLLSRTPDALVPDLLDNLSVSQVSLRFRGDRAWPKLAGPLLRKGIELYGESISVDRLWQWLQVAQDGSHSMILSAEDQTALKDWFSNRPQLVAELFRWWVEEGANWETTNSDYEFWRSLYHPERPPDLWRWQLATAGLWPDDKKGKILFRLAIQTAFWEASSSTLNELYAWAEQNPSFKKDLETLSFNKYYLPFHNKEGEERDQEAEEEAAVKAENRTALEKNLEEIRSGNSVNLLAFLAGIFLDSTVAQGDPKGLQRIEAEYGPKIAVAAVDGFQAILERHDLPTPEQIGRAEAKKRYYYVGFPAIAGMMLLFREGKLPNLGTPGARVALAFEFAHGVFEETGWYEETIRREPKAAANIIEAAWKHLLKKNVKEITHLYNVDREPAISLVARQIGFRLLESYSRSTAILLEQLMRCALVGSPREDLARLVSKRRSSLDQDQRLLWTAFSILVLPEQGLRKSEKFLQGADRDKKVKRLVNYLREFNGIGGYSLFSSTSSVLADLVLLLGQDCPPQRLTENAGIQEFEAAQFIGRLIDEIGNRTDDESISRLRALRNHRLLLPWREKLGHIIEQQRRKVREARYQRPALPEVLKVLENGGPTSLPDLHTVVCDHLRTLKNKIENGPESEYRAFWNVGPRGELQSPLPENEARSRLRFILNDRLKPLGISAEIEPQYAHGNRGDLKMIYGSMNIPLEAKRHFHKEVWTAPRTQLKAKYSIDPGAEGFGIYLVFWFGLAKNRQVPTPPNGIAPPSTASEMEVALRQIYTGEEWQNIEFICIDCSARETEKQARKRRAQQSNPQSRRAPRRQKST